MNDESQKPSKISAGVVVSIFLLLIIAWLIVNYIVAAHEAHQSNYPLSGLTVIVAWLLVIPALCLAFMIVCAITFFILGNNVKKQTDSQKDYIDLDNPSPPK